MGDQVLEAFKQALSTRQPKFLQDSSLVPAAVLSLIYPKDGEYCILLNKRTEEVEHHKGEISFPGGSREPEDNGALQTALRETHEEMGIRPEDVTILGELDEVGTISNFRVQVFVGTIPYPYPFSPRAKEVAEVLEVPVRHLLDPTYQYEEARWVNGKVSRMYTYAYGDNLIYGATAGICGQLLEVLEGVPWKEGAKS